MHINHPLVLASTSVYRRTLLERLGLPFTQESPQIDESALPGESPESLVQRLASAKAEAVAHRHPEALVIGSDQMAVLGDQVLGKPGSPERAKAQLATLSGQSVRFLTGLAVVSLALGQHHVAVVPFTVQMRRLSAAEIADYVARDNPVDAAGSFKSEGLGIALFEHMDGEDPTALIGLPLIRLTRMLSDCGIRVLG